MIENSYQNRLYIAIEKGINLHTVLGEIDIASITVAEAIKIVDVLREHRYFKEIVDFCGGFFATHNASHELKYHYCHSLLEDGNENHSIFICRKLLEQQELSDSMRSEFLGLLGRIYKQRYIALKVNPEEDQDEAANTLSMAIDNYRKGHLIDGHRKDWHTINLVALLARGEKDGIRFADNSDYKIMAAQLIEDNLHSSDPWAPAIILEAAYALKDPKMTYQSLEQLVKAEESSTFILGSVYRQLNEVWQFTKTALGREIEPVLLSALLQKPGESFSVTGYNSRNDPNISRLLTIFHEEGEVRGTQITRLEAMLRSIVRIGNDKDSYYGTGFVIDGEYVSKELSGKLLILTNSHVITDRFDNHKVIAAGEVFAQFTLLPDKPKIVLGKKIGSSPREDLDYCLCQIDVPNNLTEEIHAIKLAKKAHTADELLDDKIVIVAGHRGGGDLMLTVCRVKPETQTRERYVHYDGKLAKGYSGSPILIRGAFSCLAIHHFEQEHGKINRGILIEKIISSLNLKIRIA